MSSYNKVVLVGRLTRDAETRSFNSGGKVAKFGLAVTGSRKKNQQTGKWEEEPCFLDCEAFNRGEYGKLADTVENYCSKGSQVLVDGHLTQQNWTGQDGSKRSKLVVVVDALQLMGSKPQSGQSEFRRKADESMNDHQPTYAPDDSVPADEIPF